MLRKLQMLWLKHRIFLLEAHAEALDTSMALAKQSQKLTQDRLRRLRGQLATITPAHVLLEEALGDPKRV